MFFKKSFYISCLAILISIGSQAQQSLPNVTLQTLDGKNVDLKSSLKKGRLTVISFWATWCSPCKKELDNIKEVYAEWQEKYKTDLIAVSIDDARSVSKISPIVKSKKWNYTILSDKNEDLKRALNFQTVPFTIVVDSEGKIVYTHNGYVEGDENDLEDKLIELSKVLDQQ